MIPINLKYLFKILIKLFEVKISDSIDSNNNQESNFLVIYTEKGDSNSAENKIQV